MEKLEDERAKNLTSAMRGVNMAGVEHGLDGTDAEEDAASRSPSEGFLRQS